MDTRGDFTHSRIMVVGMTGSGKSTLAETLARKLNAPFVESDALLWGPNWIEAPDYVDKISDATAGPAWVTAGHTSKSRPILFPRADAVVYLDYSLWTTFWRLFFRTVRRAWTQEKLWGGPNTETLWDHLKVWSPVSLFHVLFTKYWSMKTRYAGFFAAHPHLHVFRFTTPEATQAWLEALPATPQ
ncbi:Aste57867_22005 [Aphanomyces stellatus]|uniref:Aste57867_22005 protein n=1 Tax=Aphanomyces stellatus TaxID=120398 RepID=A0A485LJ20_9STRA|nr:hypothetical protein As57867_021936 [Aphanomyces stellatus]VFT98673.1 Aste57867_22005 [Aphanomyces stellatus]